MKKRFAASLLASILFASSIAQSAHAQSDASTLSAISALPVASVVVSAGSVIAVPAMLSVAGTVLVVKAVEASAHATVIVLERASDDARVSLRIAGNGLAASGMAVGTAVVVSVIGAGVILSAAGEAIAFIPNALGQALLHNERLTY